MLYVANTVDSDSVSVCCKEMCDLCKDVSLALMMMKIEYLMKWYTVLFCVSD